VKIDELSALLMDLYPGSEFDFPLGTASTGWCLLPSQINVCPQCSEKISVVVRVKNFNLLSHLLLVCISENRSYSPMELSHETLVTLEADCSDFFANIGSDIAQATLELETITKNNSPEIKPAKLIDEVEPALITKVRTENPLKVAVEVPEGYRNIGWIRDYEAEAIADAYKSSKSVSVLSNGKSIFLAEFVDDEIQVQKYRASVNALRIRPNGNRKGVGWIRLEEAEAIIKATISQSNVEFQHKKFGKGGIVEFFSSESREAITYRSTTRLLRKR